ncbi:nucleotidyltransferase family protein [Micrococcus porci]|uniref:nucleotidyltransferase family protein n=1 Tax=Micrococcus porci TaxID=2856555 RepID=UPI001CD00DC1|nr:nucleotidyltransferase family protein [Micrococcus porci]UBH24469.1 nucleotidyltransferase family protein [Micrococcus porci]
MTAAPAPLETRVRLAHARITHLMAAAGVRSLHIKGYAMGPGVYAGGRTSSDVDLLVHPADLSHALDALTSHGWRRIADFAEGSVFEHAATLWHDQLGYVDVHRRLPGLGRSPVDAFEALWGERTTTVVAGHAVPVPSLRHQRLVVLVHGARDAGRGRFDVDHLRHTLDAGQWAELRVQAQILGAGAAWSIATGETDVAGVDEREALLLSAVRGDESGIRLLATRWHAARGWRERLHLLVRTVPVNRAHLQMRLGRPPTTADVLREQASRGAALTRWAAGKAVPRVGR